jgi:DNA-binding PucR family transcriptional regulator
VTLSGQHVRTVLSGLDPRTLALDVVDEVGDPSESRAVLLVPSTGVASRPFLLRHLQGRAVVVGPERPWTQVAASYRRACLVADLVGPRDSAVVDTEAHLVALICTADSDALADLRTSLLAPLAELRPAAADRLRETLRSWLLHQGRRDDIAADLLVHPQTVRYRLTQLRELFGEQLNDPQTIAGLTIALATLRPQPGTES